MVDPQTRTPPARSAVGKRLRTLRQELGLTLSDVADRTGVSVSNLSKIERGDVSPSFDIVMRICHGLDVAIEYFVKPGPKSSVTGRKTTTLRGRAIEVSSAQYDYLAHASELSRKAMVPLEMWVRARTVEEFGHWSQHEGEEFIFVIAGSIDVHTDQYAPFTLEAGESSYFDSSMKHIYVSRGDGDAHVLSISFNPEFTSRAAIESFMNPAVRLGGSKPSTQDSDED
jgi:transcriptional regulator with XRE-family HTH domain